MAFAAAVGLAAGVTPQIGAGRAGDGDHHGASQVGIAVPNSSRSLILLVIVFAVTLNLSAGGSGLASSWRRSFCCCGALVGAGGDPDPRHSVVDRSAERGLHAHRARQGGVAQAPPVPLPRRVAERADADSHHHGAAIRQPDRLRRSWSRQASKFCLAGRQAMLQSISIATTWWSRME